MLRSRFNVFWLACLAATIGGRFGYSAEAEGAVVPVNCFVEDWQEGPMVSVESLPTIRPPVADRLTPEHFSLEMLSGAYFSAPVGPKGPDFHYLPTALRLGYRPFLDPAETPWLWHTEALLEMNVSSITQGPGDIVTGPSLVLRTDLLDPDAFLVPYLQGGAGICYTDSWRDMTQRAIGEAVEFLLQAEVGLRWQVSEAWSVNVEAGFQHISNACLADRNGGLNAAGAAVGVTYRFGCRQR